MDLNSTHPWNPKALEQIKAFFALELPSPRLAVFDWDNTVIKNDVGDALFYYLTDQVAYQWTTPPEYIDHELYRTFKTLQNTEANARSHHPLWPIFRSELLHLYHEIYKKYGEEIAYQWQTQLLEGMRADILKAHARTLLESESRLAFYDEQISQPANAKPLHARHRGIRLYPQIAGLMHLLKKKDFNIWIVSASPQLLIEEAVAFFNLPVNKVLAVTNLEREDQTYTSHLSRFTYGQGKRRAILEESKHVPPHFVAGDNNGDLAMLELATELKLVIDRGIEPLKSHALKSGWVLQPAFDVDSTK